MELTLADLYAIKSQAKEKEAYYRNLKNENPEKFTKLHIYWADILYRANKDLETKITTSYA